MPTLVWEDPPFWMILSIVDALKRSNRWRLDSPSLRLVNKYWSSCITSCMTSVHDTHRESLSFTCLLRRSGWRFCDHKYKLPLSLLQKIPFLSRLTLGVGAVEDLVETKKQFKSVQSLRLSIISDYAGLQANKLLLGYRQPRTANFCGNELSLLKNQFPDLKKLEIMVTAGSEMVDSENQFDLEEVCPNLQSVGVEVIPSFVVSTQQRVTNGFVTAILGLKYLTKLDIANYRCNDIEFLDRLPMLKSLGIALFRDEHVSYLFKADHPFQLRSLKMNWDSTIHKRLTLERGEVLEDLTLENTKIEIANLVQFLPNLKSLSLNQCRLVREFSSLAEFRQLNKLVVSGATSCSVFQLCECFGSEGLDSLTCLEIDVADKIRDGELVDAVCQLHQLEELVLSFDTGSMIHCLTFCLQQGLSRLTHLRKLGLFFDMGPYFVESLLDEEIVQNLEELHLRVPPGEQSRLTRKIEACRSIYKPRNLFCYPMCHVCRM